MIKGSIVTLLSIFILSTAFTQTESSSKPEVEVYSVVKLYLTGPEQLNLMAVADIDFDHIHGDIQNGVELTLTESDVLKLIELDIKHEVLISDYAKFYEKNRLKDLANLPTVKPKQLATNFDYGSMGGFYTWAEIQSELDNMANLFPNIASQKFSIGTSIEGRTIWALKISDNPNTDENEPVAYYDAMHHAREPLAMAATMNYMYWLLENYGTDPAVTYILDNRELYFVPCVNPDGYEYNRSTNPNGGGLWRKNRRGGYGVDLNRNYSYQWGYNSSCASSSTGASTYKGSQPFSEPEAQAVRDFVAAIGATIGFSTHSTAGYHLMPTGFGAAAPPEFDIYSEWASDFLAENNYPYGTTMQMLGYTSCGTTRDYLHNTGVYAWTPEIGGSGFWPQQSEIFPRVSENVFPFFYQAWIAGGYADVQSHEIIGDAVAGSSFQIKVELKNKGAGAVANNVQVSLEPNSNLVNVAGSVSYGNIPARTKVDNANNLFNISIDPGFNQGSISFDIIVEQEGTESRRETITVLVGNKAILFSDNAEAGSGNWTASGNGTSWGVNLDDSYSGFQSFGDSNGGNITGNTNNAFTLNQSINLAGTQNPNIEYHAKWSIGPGDYINLQASTNGSNWTTIASHTDSESWIERKVSLASFAGDNVYLRFNLVTTSGISPDGFYFDDFVVADYDCPTCPVCNSSISSFPHDESFENGLNGWTQGPGDDINWTRNSGGTPSSNTGPSSSDDGSFYMYIEASNPNFPSKVAHLESPCFDLVTASSGSLSFGYHMYGASMGSLVLDVSQDDGASWTQNIWSQNGNQGNMWQSASVDLHNYLGEFVKFRFRGTTGGSYTSDIAIDKIQLTALQLDCTIGAACDDGEVCTSGETYDANCGCSGGTFQDADNDGVCDANDLCPSFDNNLIGQVCDDGDVCTSGETYDANCGCSGGTSQDTDNDGVCDANDLCPNFDDNLIGQVCDDGDSCTSGETYDANCGCSGGTSQDTDNDGVCDVNDPCPSDPQDLCNNPCNNATVTANAGADIDICLGDATQLAGSGNGITYNWTPTIGLSDPQILNPDVTLTATTTYTLTVADTNGCTATDQITITPISLPEITSSTSTDTDTGQSNGSITIYFIDVPDLTDIAFSLDGGITWSTNISDDSGSIIFSNLDAGAYDLMARNSNGLCTIDLQDEVINTIYVPNDVLCASSGTNTSYEYIQTVSLESINNDSGNNFGYSDFTAQSASINLGQSYTITLTPGFSGQAYNEHWVVSADLDGNGTFDGPNEILLTAIGNNVISGQIMIPYGTSATNAVMRVSMQYNSSPPTCGNFTYGEVEDYTLILTTSCSIGSSCDDGDNCTTNDSYDSNCNCVGSAAIDSDNDGICDTNDLCPNFDDTLIGQSCDDNDPCTTGETYDANCGCSGGLSPDSDNDGVCDAQDLCPSFDDNLIGTVCNDNDECTTNDIYTINCGCEGTPVSDSDNDGICDIQDLCPNFDDTLIGQACDDNDPCTSGETYDANCGCSGGLSQDSDNDNICDAQDLCPNFDDNLIGTGCNDNDDCTSNDVYTINCGCAGTPVLDSDNDGVCDANDLCPNLDDALIGQACDDNDPCTTGEAYDINCGCSGGLSQDSDNDSICDALDQCPNFDDTLIGTGCNDNDNCTINDIYTDNCVCMGTPASDSDNDGICDTIDPCPNFDNSLIGQACDDNDPCTTGETYDANCGCSGGTEYDSDNDGVCDAQDACPGSDDNIDLDNNGVPDSCDNCPAYNFNIDPIIAYDPGQDLGNYNIQDGGATVFMENNSWKALEINYTITPNTVISFDFKSTTQGEIHEVSFDNDLSLAPAHRIVLYGNQGYNGNYPVQKYTNQGQWQSYVIPIGTLFTGSFQYLVLTADDDNQVVGNSYFRSISFFEDMNGDLSCDAACTPGTNCDDGDPCTTGETFDALCGCTGGTMTADQDGDGVCDFIDLCPNFDDLQIGQACNDNDPCTIGEIWDITCGCSGGSYTDNDNDGFCIADDPDDNDSCVPDNSNCSDCQIYNSNDFENSLGIWNLGGSDAARSSNFAAYANSGTTAIRIRDNSKTSSSIYTDVIDFSSYAGIDFSFSFIPNSMENNEDFFLEVSADAGNNYTIIEEWNSGTEMTNNVRQDVSINIPGTLLSATTVIRIRCDASTNSDRVYLDDIQIETCGSSFGSRPVLKTVGPKGQTGSLTLYPNPAREDVFLELTDFSSNKMTGAKIVSSMGKVIKTYTIDNSNYIRLDVSQLEGGQAYLIILETTDGASFIEKFVKL